jgi:hypothetical protein
LYLFLSARNIVSKKQPIHLSTMRRSALYIGLSAFSLLQAAFAIRTLPDYAKNIPDCSGQALRNAMKDAGCKVDSIDESSIDCMCNHLGSIPIDVVRNTDTKCQADFTTSFGSVCGLWFADPSDSEQSETLKILSGKLDSGSGGDEPTKTGSDEASTGAAESDKPGAAADTRVPGIAGLAGGVVALLAVML